MKKLLIAAVVATGLLTGVLAPPAGAALPTTETFTIINDLNAVDPCTGAPMVVEMTVRATTHENRNTVVMHAKATGSSGDYRLHHGNLINVTTHKKLEGRLVELYEGPNGSRIRVAIRATFTADGPPSITFTSRCLTDSTGR